MNEVDLIEKDVHTHKQNWQTVEYTQKRLSGAAFERTDPIHLVTQFPTRLASLPQSPFHTAANTSQYSPFLQPPFLLVLPAFSLALSSSRPSLLSARSSFYRSERRRPVCGSQTHAPGCLSELAVGTFAPPPGRSPRAIGPRLAPRCSSAFLTQPGLGSPLPPWALPRVHLGLCRWRCICLVMFSPGFSCSFSCLRDCCVGDGIVTLTAGIARPSGCEGFDQI